MVRVLVGGMIALATSMGVARFAYTPILPAMQAATGLGPDGAGLLASANFLGYLLGALAAGLVPHGTVRTAVFRLSLAVSAATTAGMGLFAGPADQAMVAWSLLRLLSGLSSAGIFILGIAIVLDTLGRMGREGAAGWLYAGVGLGIVASGLFVSLLDGRLDWRGDWLALGAISAAFNLLSWLWVADPAEEPDPPAAAKPDPVVAGRSAMLSGPLLLLSACYFLQGGGYVVSGTFLVAILKATPQTAALGEIAWVVVGLAAMASGPFWARVGRRAGLWQALILGHAAQVAGILLPLTSHPAAAVAGAVLFGGTFVGIVSLSFALGRQLAPGSSNRMMAALTVLYGIGQIIGPLGAGFGVAHTGSFDVALVGAGAAVALGGVLLLAGARLNGRTGRGAPGALPANIS